MCSTQQRCIETSLYGVGVLLFEVHGRGLPPRHFVSVQTSILVQLRLIRTLGNSTSAQNKSGSTG